MTAKVNFGNELVTPEEKSRRVGAVFSSVARRYDLMNDLMSGGMHRLWKDRFVARVKPRAGEEIVDMAGGTGDVAFRMARRGAQVTVADINPDMLAVGVERAKRRGIDGLIWAEENAERLSFADRSFDAYTIAFGIRNVPRMEAALAEALRVLKHGGRFLCLEFSQVDVPMLDRAYEAYSFNAIPALGRVIAGDEEAYRYLVESIRSFPNQERFAEIIRQAGFARVGYTNFSGGIAALHSGWKI